MEIVVRATVVYWALWGLLRMGGKRELAEMTPFELIVLVIVGDLVQQGVTGEDYSTTGALLAAGTVVAWTIASSALSSAIPRVRRVLEATPALVVVDGQVQQAAMRYNRLTLEDLLDEARNSGIADLRQVRYGVLEADGKFSFILASGEPDSDDDRHRL